MDSERLKAMFDALAGNEHCSFEKIPAAHKLHPSRRLCGMLKIVSLMPHPQEFNFCAEHDVVYFVNAGELRDVTESDVIYLSRCGIFYDDDNECLATFC